MQSPPPAVFHDKAKRHSREICYSLHTKKKYGMRELRQALKISKMLPNCVFTRFMIIIRKSKSIKMLILMAR